ncbi:rhodanese-like domain-containing protein [Paenibacillus macerans]|uniref:rhodanese-like domain-containing protein n=1 Tax=Paenibacillus macerans TaxID=44252 RepID=UPI003D320151
MSFKNIKQITAREVAERLKKRESLMLLDVREPGEWFEGHIEGAKHIPLSQLSVRQKELDPKRETIVICRSGSRSGLACELLSENGFHVINMTGGLNAWTDKLVQD